MKQWMRMLAALILAACSIIVSSIVAAPMAKATSQSLWVNCSVYFQDGPREGTTEPVSFLLASGGGLTTYSSDYTSPGLGSWSSSGTTTSYSFTANLAAPTGATLSASQSFTNNTSPLVWTGAGLVYSSGGTLLFTSHTQTTCSYWIPGTTGCSITYTMSQWAGGFTATITINNDTSNAISSGSNMSFVFPGTQTITGGWNGVYNQNGNTVTVGNLAGISAHGSITTGFNGNWSGSNPNPLEYELNGIPCSVNA
ncbi:MAG TPA: cellulose binding domain-containing protein [Ktedonobacteraceae bacterium]|nr:cellulose binding domain-containing protein [Ktedonobacteraceae bacterium]